MRPAWACSAQHYQCQPERDQLLVIAHPKLSHGTGFLSAHRAVAAVESAGDVTHAVAIGEKPHHFLLARWQPKPGLQTSVGHG